MALVITDQSTQLAFSMHENKGVFALLLGSGISRSANIPTGWEITVDLIRRVATAEGIEEQPDWVKWFTDVHGAEPNYSKLLEELSPLPAERRAVLHAYIEPDEEEQAEGFKMPTPAHRAIAKLVRSGHVKVIVTTNFDRLIENALRDEGVEPTVVASLDAFAGAEPLPHTRCYVLKLHGDYKDARILNTDQELEHYLPNYDAVLDRIFDEYGLVVCGWSGEWDPALRTALLRAPSRRYPTYWANRGTALGHHARELVVHRKAILVPIPDADQFFQNLQRRVEILEVSRRQNPLSVDLLVNSVKRYLPRSEERIRLNDVIAEETERVLEQLTTAPFSLNAQWSEDALVGRISAYEGLVEPLACAIGALGSWGDDSEFVMVLDVVRRLYSVELQMGEGLNYWLYLRAYPAVLVFTAYGLGLTRASRWDSLHALFTSDLCVAQGSAHFVAEKLFLQAWIGEADIWSFYPGLKSRLTPLSDHLFDVMQGWSKRFIGVVVSWELLFGLFETLGSLACFGRETEEDIRQAFDDTQVRGSRGAFVQMPIGYASARGSVAVDVFTAMQSTGLLTAILESGFAHGRKSVFELFAENFRRMAR